MVINFLQITNNTKNIHVPRTTLGLFSKNIVRFSFLLPEYLQTHAQVFLLFGFRIETAHTGSIDMMSTIVSRKLQCIFRIVWVRLCYLRKIQNRETRYSKQIHKNQWAHKQWTVTFSCSSHRQASLESDQIWFSLLYNTRTVQVRSRKADQIRLIIISSLA